MIVVVGPSGCGKSTLLRMVAGLEEITDGEIFINNTVVNRLEPRERDIAMVFQNYALYPHMTVYKNMAYGLQRRNLSKEEIKKRIEKTAAMLGLDKLLERKPKQLSGGQRQRVAMGRAIVREPVLYLFDEPLSNLDANLRGQMRLEIRKLQRQLKTTTLYVTHDQVEAMTMADRIVLMNQGGIEQVGTPEEIYHHPQSVFVGGFMGAPPMNFLHAKINDSADAIILHGGTVLPLSTKKSKDYANKAIILGVRPESIIKAGKEGADAFQLQVNMIEALGAEKLIYGHFPGDEQTLTVRVPNKVSSEIGEVLTLGVMPDSLHVFDKDSGKRV
jgi:sn-glycerol 3-phosphate transport system ATP-binding protein